MASGSTIAMGGAISLSPSALGLDPHSSVLVSLTGEALPVSQLLLTQKSVTYPPGLFCYPSTRLFMQLLPTSTPPGTMTRAKREGCEPP